MLVRILIAAVLLIALQFMPFLSDAGWLRFVLYLVPYLVIGYDILLKAWKGIRNRQIFDENFLMAVATVGAIALALYERSGDYTEAIAVMLFYQVGEWFQSYAVGKSRRNISELMDIRPDYANVEKDGRLERVDPDEVEIGSFIVVQPGEKVPIDGVIVEGSSSLNTSALTGESLPRDAKAGDEIISGCINMTGVLKIRTTKEFGESTVSRILDLVENASSRKSRSEDFISRFARIYTPAVCYAALALAVLPPLVRMLALGMPADWGTWIYRALTFLVISCPCALVISIPLSFFAGIGGASNAGVLVKGSNYLEILSKTGIVVFDKTGTLTTGKLKVSRIVPMEGCTQQDVLHMAAVAESYSNHPIAQSIVAQAGDLSGASSENYQELAGMGIRVTVDGKDVLCGAKRLMDHYSIPVKETDANIYVAVDGKLIGTITVSDQLREDSASAISALRKLGVEKTVMLTGDNEKTAAKIAKECGVDEHYSSLMPADKVEHLKQIKQQGGATLFVGDGINDAPVLAIADAGVAMGLGTDAAIEAADVVLMSDKPSALVRAVEIAKHAMRIVKFNIAFALIIKIGVLALGVFGMANMWMAVFADVGVSIIAVLNSTRILLDRKK